MKTLLSLVLLCAFGGAFAQKYPYQNPALGVEERVADLLSRMSLREKIRQMDMYKGEFFKVDEQFDAKTASKAIDSLGVGAIHDVYPKSAKMINDLQTYVIARNRWKIPALIMCEMLHGYLGEGATAFPMNIGLGATWDKALMQRVGEVIATEGRIHGVHFGLGPVLEIGREPRWGRVAETFGEDAYLAGELGSSFIKGMKGEGFHKNTSMISEPKHYAAHSVPEAGGNSAPIRLGERTVREDFLPAFEKGITKGGALGVMAAYTELDGIPVAANPWLLTQVLRKEWGFKGIVVSDLGAILFLQSSHHVSDSHKESIRQAITAGLDMQFYDFPNEEWQNSILELYKEGKLSLNDINRAAGGVLRLKFLLGLFENPYTEQSWIDQKFHSKENQALALEAGHKSIVLLKNENGLLPLKKNLKTVAVIGPNANSSDLGGYAVRSKVGQTVLEGLKAVLDKGTEIVYEEGVPLVIKGQSIEQSQLWTPDEKSEGLKGEYFNNTKLEGTPALTRIDKKLEFDWPWSPGKGVNDVNFSIRWSGYLKPTVSFEGWLGFSSDDGARLWVDDVLVIDHWSQGVTNISTYPMKFEKGKKYKLKIEMWEGAWGARMHLRWNLKKIDFSPAVEAAKKADIAIVVVGESRELVEENKDTSILDLHGLQEDLVKAIHATGTPVVCVLLNGRPLSINWINDHIPAILEGWFPGEYGGRAVADVIFGNYNPGGKLPISFPKSVGQIPIYYNQKPSKNHKYIGESMYPLYKFGYGLSYTTFEYSNLKLSSEIIKNSQHLQATVWVKNTGNYDGEEVVQLYIRDLVSSVTRPEATLAAFERIHLKKGETRNVTLDISSEELSLWNRDMKRVVEAGDFEVMVGGNLDTVLKKTFKVVD